jgi:hypothetical protein
VLGGKIDQVVVNFLGVIARELRISAHRIVVDVQQTPCFPHSVPLGHMLDDRNYFFLRQPRVEKNRVAVLGKSFFALQTIQQPGVVFPVSRANADIISAPNAAFFTIFIQATKLFEVVHDRLLYAKSLQKQKLQLRMEL